MDETTKKTLLEASGYRIPPYRLARMSDVANRIVKLILTDTMCSFTAEEAKIILQVAEETIGRGMA